MTFFLAAGGVSGFAKREVRLCCRHFLRSLRLPRSVVKSHAPRNVSGELIGARSVPRKDRFAIEIGFRAHREILNYSAHGNTPKGWGRGAVNRGRDGADLPRLSSYSPEGVLGLHEEVARGPTDGCISGLGR